MTPAEVLRAAADLLEVDGWCQFDLIGPAGERCVMGAICGVIGRKDADDERLVDDAVAILARDLGVTIRDVSVWNDDPSQTAENVVAAMRRAAREAEA